MKRIVVLVSALLALSIAASAQPVATGAVNAASYASTELPNGKLAQGGMFIVFGQRLGPATPQVLSFPLTTVLDGTSVKVTVGGTSVDCIMIYALTGQVACILPSNTPVGAGTLTVTTNGQASAVLPIEVVAHSFGIFAINNAGSGPGIFTDTGFVVNTLVHAGHAGEAWTIWGTGLGPVAGDEKEHPLPGDIAGLNVKVLVGDKEAPVLYRGRSGCCAGVDQIAFTVPAGVTGCYVPVVVVDEGVSSNFTTMSIAESGDICSESSGVLTSQNLQTAILNGAFRFGTVNLSRSSFSFTAAASTPAQTFEFSSESGGGAFLSYSIDQLLRTQSIAEISTFGACSVVSFRSSGQGEFEDPVQAQGLDAGDALSVTGPEGTKPMPKIAGETGLYGGSFSSSGFPGVGLRAAGPGRVGQLPGSEPYLVPGNYTISGPGGAQVGPFTANLTIPERLIWTNKDAIATVQRAQGQPITWTGGTTNGFVQITGSSLAVFTDTETVGASFFCRASASALSFTIPAAVLLALPPSVSIEGTPSGSLSVGNGTDGEKFTASGIDLGIAGFSDLTLKSGVGYN